MILFLNITFNWVGSSNLCPDTSITTSRDLSPDTLFKDFDRLYRRMLSALLGNHFENPSKRHLQPRTVAFIDLPNSQCRSPQERYKKRTQYNPHIHAVMVLRADLAAKIPDGGHDIFFLDIADQALGARLDTIRVYEIPLSDVGAVTRYSGKLAFRDIKGIDPTDLFQVWPRALSERSKNNRSWDVTPTPTTPSQCSPRRDAWCVNSLAGRWDLKREFYADSGKWTRQKIDAMITLAEHAPQLEALYSTVPRWCRAKIKEAFEIILHGQEEDMWRYIKACRGQWDALSLVEIAAPATCSDMSRYVTGDPAAPFRRQTPVHLQGAIYYNGQLDKKGLTGRYKRIEDGDAIKYLLLLEPNPISAAAIGFGTVLPNEFGLDPYVDRNAQFNLCFRQPLVHALSMIGWRDMKRRKLGALANGT
jgi:hypothetical protein